LCFYCADRVTYSPKSYAKNIRQGLDFLKSNVPRLFINFITAPDVAGSTSFNVYKNCDQSHRGLCPCISSAHENDFPLTNQTRSEYEEEITKMLADANYDSNDFAVVVQPVLNQIVTPYAEGSTEPDRSFLASDCTHFNRKGQVALAKALWKNMLLPVGEKSQVFNMTAEFDSELQCPDPACPYFRTNANSLKCGEQQKSIKKPPIKF